MADDKTFKVIGVMPGEVYFNGRIVDLRILSNEQADELIEEGIPYLKAVAKPRASNKASEE